MTKQIINVGSGELTGDGESLRAAFVKVNGNFDDVYTAVDNINNAGYLTTSTLPNKLGNLYITGTNLQSIAGSITNADIALVPNGTGSVSVPSLKIPVGTILGSNTSTIYTLAQLTLTNVVSYSHTSTDTLVTGQYGLLNGVAAPYAVYEFTQTPDPALQVGDLLSGSGIPNILPGTSVGFTGTVVLAVGTGTYSNYVVGYSNYSVNPIPTPGTAVLVGRNTLNANLSVTTQPVTDIALTPGIGGNIIVGSSIIPLVNDTYDLGSPGKRWRHVWVGAGTIYILDETLGTDTAIGSRDGVVYLQGGVGLNVGEFTFVDNQIKIANNSRDIIIGTTTATGKLVLNRPLQVNTTASNASFTVDRDGKVSILYPNLPTGKSAFSVLATAGSNEYALMAPLGGSLIHGTAKEGSAAFVTVDSFSDTTGGGYFTTRRFRGTVASPAAVQLGDTMGAFATAGYNGTGIRTGVSSARITFKAAENFNTTSQSAYTEFRNQVTGTGVDAVSAIIDATGLTLPSVAQGGTGTGITFADSTRQTTAWTGTVQLSQVQGLANGAVTQINVGNGLTQTTSTGIVGIDATGVQTTVGTANQIIVTDSGSKNLTLNLPQNINTTASVTFQNITVTGNINVIGTATIATNASVVGKILYLASSATNIDQIDGGGIQLGTGTFAKSILYSKVNDWWDTDGAGVKTLQLNATTATIETLRTTGVAKLGTVNEDNTYPNAFLQIDANVNSYSQVVSVNHSTGTSASTDFVAVNNIGNDGANYIDLGINSSVYADAAYSISSANDGYLFVNGGNITIGTQSAGKNIVFHTGGTTADKLRATISDAGLTIVGTLNGLTLPSTSTTAGYVLSNNGSGVTSWVQPQTGYVGSRGVSGFTGSQGIQGVTGFTGSQGIQGLTGYTGYTGSRGTDGVVGYNGSVGYTGSRGDTGTGYTGSAGTIGGTGYTGSAGTNGATGYVGSQGVQGVTGFVGSAGTNGTNGTNGFTGSAGVQGANGFTGSQGNTGTTGATGYTGSKGDQGSIGGTGYTGSLGGLGYTGSQGVGYTGSASTVSGYTGSLGSVGYTGSAGTNGNTGFTGSQGNTGTTGATGYTGSVGGQGQPGATGYTGSAGTNGTNGTNGTIGYTGSAGTNGTNGAIGYTGSLGTNGTNGYTGSKGDLGYTGSQGIQGITGNTGYNGSKGDLGYTGSIGYTGSASTVIGYTGSQGVGYTGSAGVNGVTSITGGNNIILSTSTGAVSITRIDGSQTVVTNNSTATYTLLSTDQYFGSTRSTVGACTVTLPLGSSVTVGRQYIIKDEGGQSSTFSRRITLTAAGSDTIDGSATRTITSNYGALTVLWTGTRWSVI